MPSHTIDINNCNNIISARIPVSEGTLNILFGHNGTGKSTISEAIRLKVEEKDLNELTPFSDDELDEKNKPSVGTIPFRVVKVFNDEYIRQYLFKANGDVFEDSYSVFLDSKECADLSDQISNHLKELQESTFQGDSIKALSETLSKYISAVKYSDKGISKRGGIGEVLKGCGAGFEKYSILDKYRPFYSTTAEKLTSWASWRTEGIKQMNGNACPFCASGLEEETINNENDKIKTVFKKSALQAANAIIDYIKTGIENGYITSDSQRYLEMYMGDETKENELLSELGQLGEETLYLHKKMQTIDEFRPMNVTNEELGRIENTLKKMKIEERQMTRFYTTDKTLGIIREINERIDDLLSNTGVLKGLFFKHRRKLDRLIEKRRQDINDFFVLAGFPYEFDLIENGENKATTCLRPIGQTQVVKDPIKHLSWGERNAFSLVMFMFDAINDGADLIVLDDPIASIDTNKKFAVVKRMFDNQKEITFRGKTVLMLTHDLQPVIDYIHNDLFSRFGLRTGVKAEYLENRDGVISVQEIGKNDLVNIVSLTKTIAEDSKTPLYVRIVNARKHIELLNPNYINTEAYNILSNLIHGRATPSHPSNQPMTPEDINKGIKDLEQYSLNFDSYESILNELTAKLLFQEIDNPNTYFKIIAIRLLLERNEKAFSGLRSNHPEAFKFMNETNHIENDYIFQLNPEKYFPIPDNYLKKICGYLYDNKEEFEF